MANYIICPKSLRSQIFKSNCKWTFKPSPLRMATKLKTRLLGIILVTQDKYLFQPINWIF